MTAPNWANRTMWTGDNLDIMRGMNSESVDLIYLDPPFNSNRNFAAPIGSKAAGRWMPGFTRKRGRWCNCRRRTWTTTRAITRTGTWRRCARPATTGTTAASARRNEDGANGRQPGFAQRTSS
ncbi:MAG: hypothetical protein OXN19_16105 [Caldilineaceae bacterium]|nr:hypothetical protein [Caldilineaceae bacterium]